MFVSLGILGPLFLDLFKGPVLPAFIPFELFLFHGTLLFRDWILCLPLFLTLWRLFILLMCRTFSLLFPLCFSTVDLLPVSVAPIVSDAWLLSVPASWPLGTSFDEHMTQGHFLLPSPWSSAPMLWFVKYFNLQFEFLPPALQPSFFSPLNQRIFLPGNLFDYC